MVSSMLPPGTRLGSVHLRVGDLEHQVAFYEEVVGLSLLAEDGATAALGIPEERPLLVLHADPSAPPRENGSTGLFHMAFRVPTRADLGSMVVRIRNSGHTIEGFADHNVSEALYLRDPEGNGIEIYADRPEEIWHSVDGSIFMTTEPMDLHGLLLAASTPSPRLPAGTVLGHMHLRVSSLASAEGFYVGRLGFDVTNRTYPGALFVSAAGYHHHLGLNVWGGEGARRPADGSLGLVSFEVVVPSAEARKRILHGADEGIILDGDGVGVRIARA